MDKESIRKDAALARVSVTRERKTLSVGVTVDLLLLSKYALYRFQGFDITLMDLDNCT